MLVRARTSQGKRTPRSRAVGTTAVAAGRRVSTRCAGAGVSGFADATDGSRSSMHASLLARRITAPPTSPTIDAFLASFWRVDPVDLALLSQIRLESVGLRNRRSEVRILSGALENPRKCGGFLVTAADRRSRLPRRPHMR